MASLRFVGMLIIFQICPAMATTIDFEDLGPGNAFFNSYSSMGFQLTNDGGGLFRFRSPPAGFPPIANPPSRTLAPTSAPSTTVLRRVDGSLFSFSSIDLAEGEASTMYLTVGAMRFGFETNAGFTFEDVVFDAQPGLQTFSFIGKTDLLSVTWTQTATQLDSSSFAPFDNIIVSSPIPEPSIVSLLVAGLAGILLWRRTLNSHLPKTVAT